ncbi:hypothetical protein BegalDRAFT_1463 [Beggiatoa alba B18LD]|uniref:DUF1902 domain-containing protein n=2 Tax=Beggiatoa TaxID=1021 RepID=I3CFF8_9GAMM|nr:MULTISPECIES: type II toxin-antitoxin system HicB family antitoxin [Beggiatoa]ALG68066.1 type II toxin-antitoxin system HicB family antitoxin [Beggiatoa leptomitoformis]AUI69643.1 type II toxin-antitoxin system HicB family antitoxin [Beggiatoa leptomitoformis]EIJ42351.1 hypothetical protein BegalDRAFT_1463 [Beggiatoa alba B18LD]
METLIRLHIEKLPEGYYLATSKDVQGLVAQGETLEETISIAQDVAKCLLLAQAQNVRKIPDSFDCALVIGV